MKLAQFSLEIFFFRVTVHRTPVNLFDFTLSIFADDTISKMLRRKIQNLCLITDV